MSAPPESRSSRHVRFHARDARLPPAPELLDALWGDTVLEGQVVACSRADDDECVVVVKVEAIDRLVVVSEACLFETGR